MSVVFRTLMNSYQKKMKVLFLILFVLVTPSFGDDASPNIFKSIFNSIRGIFQGVHEVSESKCFEKNYE